MRTIIAGSRTITDYNLVVESIEFSGFPITQVVSGGAYGADRLGERYAKEHNIPLVVFPAKWNEYGKKAGYLRNVEMAENADALICIIENDSKGASHMINIARERGLRLYILSLGENRPSVSAKIPESQKSASPSK